ncbi:hypothetical protein GCM10023210_17810 [Chryseobacterium ginsengisoli]|uniref:PKD domain-containing protein n=1 Tax=Chryseobacterium ginsengisoli TaxID=363853 RepID=A0ABP9M580_9FLAO
MKKIILFLGLMLIQHIYAQSPLSKITATASGNTVSFLNSSSGAVNSIVWDFPGGNPATSTDPNPNVSYASEGIYTAKLTVSNTSGSSTSTRTIKIGSGNSIDLSSAKNNDGTLMADNDPDSDWTYTDPTGLISTPITRYAASGWSSASTGNIAGISRWITGNNSITGYHDYVSKEFEIPAGTTTATLNLRSLSFVRNWTYLVKKNTDGTETETQITLTTYMSDGAKGWLNSRSPEVISYPLVPGIYYIKVKLYTNSGAQRQAIDVNANVNFGSSVTISPIAEFSGAPLSTTVGNSVQFNNLLQGSPLSTNWKFNDGTNTVTSTQNNPAITFPNPGLYYAELSADYGNNLVSTLKIDNYIQILSEKDYTKAPNSYIFYKDGLLPNGNKADGLYIPVKKAYQMWKSGRYMQNDQGNYTPIDLNGSQAASVYWEDINGLIKSVTIDTSEGSGENARIKVLIDKTKGEGNASIAFKVNNTIYWTWHVWVTDNPENGSSYGQNFETDFTGNPFTPQYMDRNLGATNASFLGNDWNKSGGLMYQWGRKDPFPPLVYKDNSFYEITGDVGSIRHRSAALATSIIPVISRGTNTGSNNIGGNIRYSINNPINIIIHSMNDGTWFSNQEYKSPNTNSDLVETWDLWSDNRKGLNSNASSVGDPNLAADSKSYKLKSEFDPCPNGWRVPSHYGRNTINNNMNPLGRKNSGFNDDIDNANSMIYPNSFNPVLSGVKVYPGLGIDFRGIPERNIGIIPMNGNYEYYGPEASGANYSATQSLTYQDQSSDGSLGTATYGIGGVRGALFYSSPEDVSKSATGWNAIYVNQTGKTNTAGGMRCMKDPNIGLLPIEYNTQYISSSDDNTDYKSWVKEPNSYVVMTGESTDTNATDQVLKISLKKAYAMHKLYLSKQLPSGANNTASVVWSTNTALIKNIKITGVYPDQEMEVTLAAKQKGNAVVAFHKGNNGVWGQSDPDKILWSWHIWAPVTNPLDPTSQVTYTTESVANGGIISSNAQLVNPTKSLAPPLTTVFMDRNLGALNSFPTSASGMGATALLTSPEVTNSGGLHYQWGRKDPIPTFLSPGGLNAIPVYKQISYTNNTIGYSAAINDTEYTNSYTKEYSTYTNSGNANVQLSDAKNEKIRKVLKYSAENPLFFMYRNKSGNEETIENGTNFSQKAAQVKDWISDENGQVQDRWGHATEKSPYDPCPSGWRVPDTSSAALFAGGPNGSYAKGTSPWFYNGYNTSSTFANYGIAQGGIAALTEGAINNTTSEKKHPGFAVIRYTAPASRVGFIFSFTDSKYNIGNIPVTGIRGILGGNNYQDKLWELYLNNRYRTGLWTSSPADNYSGYAIALDLFSISTAAGQNGRLATGIGRYPQAAMGVRCVKDTERYMGDLPYSTSSRIAEISQVISSLKNNIEINPSDEIEIYPNPVKDLLYVKSDTEMLYEIYDMGGRIISKGQTSNRQINVLILLKGSYILKLYSDKTTVTKKFIKK